MLFNRNAALACGLALAAATCVVLPAAPTAHAATKAADARGATSLPPASTGWHGRAIREPHARHAENTLATERSAGRALRRGAGNHAARGSDRVRDLQRQLRRLGYRPGPVDGRFGPRTQGAVRWFQIKHGFAPTGVAGRATLRHLRDRAAGREKAPAETVEQPRQAEPDRETAPAATEAQPPAAIAGGDPEIDNTVMTALLAGLAILGLTVVAASYAQARRRLGTRPAGRRTARRRVSAPAPSSPLPAEATTEPERRARLGDAAGETVGDEARTGAPRQGAPTGEAAAERVPGDTRWPQPPPGEMKAESGRAREAERVIGGAR